FSEPVGGLAGAGTVNLSSAALGVGGNDVSSSFNGTITGAGTLTKVGTGTLTLAGACNYTGPTVVAAGTLRLGAANVLPDASNVTLADFTTFDLSTFSDAVGSLAGTGTVSLAGGTPPPARRPPAP